MAARYIARAYPNILLRKKIKLYAYPIRQFSVQQDSTEDQQLHASYSGIFPRMKTIFALLFRGKESSAFQKMVDDGILDLADPGGSAVIFADLQNPLLQKYNFSPKEFCTGAKIAYSEVAKSMSLLSEASFFPDKAQNKPYLDDHRQFLKEVFSPKLYRKFEISLKEMELFRQMNVSFESQTLDRVEVENIRLLTINTKLYTKPLKKNISDMNIINTKETSQTPGVTAVAAIKEEDKAETTTSTAATGTATADIELYTPGSVIASVLVKFDAIEESILKDKEKLKKKVNETWMFEACISGQTPLNWIVKSMSR
jgi:hypothetical protein